jgi:hypothetical protein
MDAEDTNFCSISIWDITLLYVKYINLINKVKKGSVCISLIYKKVKHLNIADAAMVQ